MEKQKCNPSQYNRNEQNQVPFMQFANQQLKLLAHNQLLRIMMNASPFCHSTTPSPLLKSFNQDKCLNAAAHSSPFVVDKMQRRNGGPNFKGSERTIRAVSRARNDDL